jgi:putative membrane protein insertion efficiency factor
MILAGSGSNMPRVFILALIAFYRRWISPALPPACRYHPTCSQYMAEAIATHGVVRGVTLGLRRLGRCHPWCEGGVDPVPPARSSETPRAKERAREVA